MANPYYGNRRFNPQAVIRRIACPRLERGPEPSDLELAPENHWTPAFAGVTGRGDRPVAPKGAVEAALRQNLYLEDRAGREIVDVDLEDALRLSLVVRYRF